MIAITSLLVVVVISLLVTRIATVLLVATGLSRQAARFQARSAFTGSGFTTRESEAVVDHPLRRRVIMTLMLLGNAGIVASASSLIIGLRSDSLHDWRLVVELVVGLAALYFVSRSARVDRWLTNAIAKLLGHFTDLPRRDLGGLLQLSGDYEVKELAVTSDDWVAERSLANSELRDEGIVVLGLTRPGGTYLGAPTGSTRVHEGDLLIVYGRAESLQDLDHRPRGSLGDRLHAAAVARQEQLELRERTSEGDKELSAPPRSQTGA